MNGTGLAASTLRDALRQSAAGCLPETAAVELLITHRYWLTHDDFRLCLDVDEDGPAGCAGINWADADFLAEQLEVAGAASPGDLAVLRLAVSIANGPLGRHLSRLDTSSAPLAVAAVAAALGLPLIAHPV